MVESRRSDPSGSGVRGCLRRSVGAGGKAGEVSKRPATGGPVRSRMSGLTGYFRDRPIWVKLGLIVVVPTIATVFVGFSSLLGNINSANNAARTRTVAALTGDASVLTHALQNERAAATLLLTTTDPSAQKSALANYQGLFATTAKAAHDYSQRSATLTGLPPSFRDLLTSINAGIGSLDKLHQQVAASGAPLIPTIQQYNALISNLI